MRTIFFFGGPRLVGCAPPTKPKAGFGGPPPPEENNLATIVGTKTPGRLLSGSAYKVGHGYILGLPVAAYLTWQGRMLENNGIVPKFSIELSREALKQGRDTQLGTAIEVANAL